MKRNRIRLLSSIALDQISWCLQEKWHQSSLNCRAAEQFSAPRLEVMVNQKLRCNTRKEMVFATLFQKALFQSFTILSGPGSRYKDERGSENRKVQRLLLQGKKSLFDFFEGGYWIDRKMISSLLMLFERIFVRAENSWKIYGKCVREDKIKTLKKPPAYYNNFIPLYCHSYKSRKFIIFLNVENSKSLP